MPQRVASDQDLEPLAKWFRPSEVRKPRGVALVVHGLNLNPDCMAPLISVLNESEIDCIRLALRGHGDNFCQREGLDSAASRLEDFKEVSYALWFQEMLTAYSKAQQHAAANRLPLFLVGYSYGGLIGLDLLATDPNVAFDRAVLLAPALSLHGWDYAVRLLAPFPKLVLPTLALVDYPSNLGTPLAAYNALFETLDHFETCIGPQINIPTLVIINPSDELVSFDGIRRLVEKHRLDQWRFFPIPHCRSLPHRMFHHMVIDETSVGREIWIEIKKEMTAQLLRRLD
jgi:pimeloyl-ACP methyl ester carboxylesterase